MASYEEFYKYVCRIMRCSFVDAGERLQELLVQFLRNVGDSETRAADWFSGGADLSKGNGCLDMVASASRPTIAVWSQHGDGIGTVSAVAVR